MSPLVCSSWGFEILAMQSEGNVVRDIGSGQFRERAGVEDQ